MKFTVCVKNIKVKLKFQFNIKHTSWSGSWGGGGLSERDDVSMTKHMVIILEVNLKSEEILTFYLIFI